MSDSQLFDIAKKLCDIKKIELIGYIGKGAFKETFLVRIDDLTFALKIADPKKVNIERLRREISCANKCDSPYIVTIKESDSIIIDGICYYFIIEEYLDGGTLTKRLENMLITRDFIINITFGLINAIQCLKDNGLVHRDIKPDNIMFKSTQDIPILVDFGLVRDLNAYSLTKSFFIQGPGTPYFASPEQLNNEKSLISWKSDQFSLGIVLAFCISGTHPYGPKFCSPDQAVQNVSLRASPQPWFIDEMNKKRLAFINRMIEPWPIRRFHSIEDWIDNVKGCII